jgi:hypothetical protein
MGGKPKRLSNRPKKNAKPTNVTSMARSCIGKFSKAMIAMPKTTIKGMQSASSLIYLKGFAAMAIEEPCHT